MLKDNLKTLRKNKGLSQEELSIKLNVVRQTISKWELGLSVPDAEMLITIANFFETPVNELLGENIEEKEKSKINEIAEKLEVINEQLAIKQKQNRKKIIKYLVFLDIFIILLYITLILIGSPYQSWDYSKIEWSVIGTIEWIFFKVAPFIIIVITLILGIILIKKNKL